MSFATSVKNEICNFEGNRSEKIAILSAFIRNNRNLEHGKIILITENATVARKVYLLLKEVYDINVNISQIKGNNFSKNSIFQLEIEEKIMTILEDLSVFKNNEFLNLPNEYIIDDEEQKRAYLLGCFLAKGSINDPKTSRYHLEFLIESLDEANLINSLLNEFDLNSKVLSRDKGYMVYIKEAEKIGDFLRIIYASNAVLYYEDIRIYRDHKNMTNRLNNCEQANMDKIILTAKIQIDDINYLKDKDVFDLLDDKVKEAANYRIKYPEASLQELSDIITYETGKSITKPGLNHRFRKIKELVNKIKENE